MATPEGNRLAALRQLRGLSLEDCAQAVGLSPQTLEQVERGEGRDEDVERLAKIFGLQVTGDEWVEPDDSSTFTVFLLHSATPTFDSADLVMFEEAMRAARIFTAQSPNAEQTALNRRRFKAVPPALPNPRDAAKQGHRLARQVREALKNPDQPLGDMRKLLEEHFGIPVLVRGLRSSDLRAAAALDADRVCAAVLLSEDDGSRLLNPRLTSVYLAHELCHILFDPSRPGRVQIALDDQIKGEASAGRNKLLEARAKGFAAELLLPEAGLARLFVNESAPNTLNDAATRVRRALNIFQTPREIAIRHLKNLGYITHDQAEGLLAQKDLRSLTDSTVLPSSGELPICFDGVPAAASTWAATRLQAPHVPAFVSDAQSTARRVSVVEIKQILVGVEEALSKGREFEATDILALYVDTLILGDELVQVREVFAHLDVEHLEPGVTTTLAGLTARSQRVIGPEWKDFRDRLLTALRDRWAFPEERRNQIAARLRDRDGNPQS